MHGMAPARAFMTNRPVSLTRTPITCFGHIDRRNETARSAFLTKRWFDALGSKQSDLPSSSRERFPQNA